MFSYLPDSFNSFKQKDLFPKKNRGQSLFIKQLHKKISRPNVTSPFTTTVKKMIRKCMENFSQPFSFEVPPRSVHGLLKSFNTKIILYLCAAVKNIHFP
jgi:hypothetical protein